MSQTLKSRIKDTLHLPKGKIPVWRKTLRFPPSMDTLLSQKHYHMASQRTAPKQFILHDGPPYANGDLHIGHLLNKVLKDIHTRFHSVSGYSIHYQPGWDCHGLPIEHKVLKANQRLLADPSKAMEIRSLCKESVRKTIAKHLDDFQTMGIMGDWQGYYATHQKQYESKQYEAFATLLRKNMLYYDLKPVYWSPSSQTALAEAEIEYNENHVSPSCYMTFPVDIDHPTHLCIWTTTPWTLPGNRAVSISPDIDYVVISVDNRPDHYIVARSLYPNLVSQMGVESCEIVRTVSSEELTSYQYHHPIYPSKRCPIITGSHVTEESGTGLVHTAPSHGFDDYLTCLQHGVGELEELVDGKGRYLPSIGIEELVSLPVHSDGNDKIIEMIEEKGLLLKVSPYTHKYPYDWRTKQPLLIRATPQWFISLEKLIPKAVGELGDVSTHPAIAKDRFTEMLSNRKGDWCISRQRVWGLPIPAFYFKDSQEVLVNEEIIHHISQLVASHGSDIWFDAEMETLLPEKYRHLASQLYRKNDTMDVWLDSGCSSHLIHPNTASMVLEGNDQLRGWFQSSLLLSLAAFDQVPYRKIAMHGFVLDGEGRKMSKSLGNVVGLKETLKEYNMEVLRWWVASSNYTRDILISDEILEKSNLSIKRIYNSLRYMVLNLSDYPDKACNAPVELFPIDQMILHQFHALIQEVRDHYKTGHFAKITSILNTFCSNDLSGHYFNYTKDALYTSIDKEDAQRRRFQYVFNRIFLGLSLAIHPILPFTSEYMFQEYAKGSDLDYGSLLDYRLDLVGEQEPVQPEILAQYASLIGLKDGINQSLDRLRKDGEVKSSLDASVRLSYSQRPDYLSSLSDTDIADFFGVSSLTSHTVDNTYDISFDVAPITDCRPCSRCWKVIVPKDSPSLFCARCSALGIDESP